MTDLRSRADALLRGPAPFDEWVAGNIFDDFIQRYLKGGPWNHPDLINHLGAVLKLAREVAEAEMGERQAFMRELAEILDGIHAEVAPLAARMPVDLATRRDVAGWTDQLEIGEPTEIERAMHNSERKVQALRPDREVVSRQRLPYFIGISGQTVGATGLSMHIVVIPPGGRAEPHVHVGYETGIYVLEGRVCTRWGHALEHEVVSIAGDFLFVPPDVPHEAINLSATEPARAVVARNDPAEQDKVEPYSVAVPRGAK